MRDGQDPSADLTGVMESVSAMSVGEVANCSGYCDFAPTSSDAPLSELRLVGPRGRARHPLADRGALSTPVSWGNCLNCQPWKLECPKASISERPGGNGARPGNSATRRDSLGLQGQTERSRALGNVYLHFFN